MHQEKLVSVLAEIFARQGFETTTSAQLAGQTGEGYEAPLLAEREDLALLVDFYDENLDSAILQVLEDVVRDTGADLGLLIHTGTKSPLTEVPARIMVWDTDELARVLGAHQLAEFGIDARGPQLPDPVPAELLEMPLEETEPAAAVPLEQQVDFLDAPQVVEAAAIQTALPEAIAAAPVPAEEPAAAAPVEPALPEPVPIAAHPVVDVWRAPMATLAPPAPAPRFNLDAFLGEADEEAADAVPVAVPTPEPDVAAAPQAEASHEPELQARVAAASSPVFAPLVEAAAAAAAIAPLIPAPVVVPTPAPPPAIPLPESLEPETEVVEPPVIPQAFATLVPAAMQHPVIADTDPLSDATRPEPITPRLPVKVTLAQAKAHSDPELFGMERYELALVPVHLFDFEVDLLVPGSLKTQTERGRIQVHGSDKRADEVDPDEVEPSLVGILPTLAGVPWSDRVLRVSPDRAQQMAQDHVIQCHTKAIDVPLDYDAGLTARRKVTPAPNNVRLRNLGVYLRPMWRIWGPNGQMDVDGITGEVVELVLKGADAGFEVLRGGSLQGR